LQKLFTLLLVNYFPFGGVLGNINLSILTKTIFINYFPYDVIYGKFLVNISENSEYTPPVAVQFARLFCPLSIFCKFSLFTKLPFVFSQLGGFKILRKIHGYTLHPILKIHRGAFPDAE